MILTLAEAKSWGIIEVTDDDTEITALITAAETYLTNAGCTLIDTDELAKLAVKMLVIHWYENREVIGKAEKLAYGLAAIITQLQNMPVAEETV